MAASTKELVRMLAIGIFVVLVVAVAPRIVQAQNCVPTGGGGANICFCAAGSHTNLNQLKNFRVNVNDVDTGSPFWNFGVDSDLDAVIETSEPHVDEDEAVQAAILAASIWNEDGNGGYFQYDEVTSATDADCNATTGYSVIHFMNQSGAQNLAWSKCSGTRFLIQIFAKLGNGTYRPWDNAATNQTAVGGNYIRDVVGTIVHELGHTQDLGDVTSANECVMGNINNHALIRDVYEYDHLCLEGIAGYREVEGWQMFHTSASRFGAPQKFTGVLPIVKATSGITYDGATVRTASTYHEGTALSWDENSNGSGQATVANVSTRSGVGFQTAIFYEDTTDTDRVFYSIWSDTVQYDQTAVHKLRQARSTTEFTTNPTLSEFKYCTAMTGASCTASDFIYTGRNVAVAYADGSINRTVMAWLNQDHSASNENSDASEIWLAVGKMDDSTIGMKSESGIRSAVAPGLACKENFTSTWDCLLVYVPIDDMTNPIEAVRVQIAASGSSWALTYGSVYTLASSARTGNGITVWWHSHYNKFYVAYRSANNGQPLAIQSSADGQTWAMVDSDVDDIIGPPSANSIWNKDTMTSSMLVWTKTP